MPSDNVIRIMCPNLKCRSVLAVPTTARGKLVRCKKCGTTIMIPAQRVAEGKPGASAAATDGAAKPQVGQPPADPNQQGQQAA